MSTHSLVIPVYNNADSLARLLPACEGLSDQLGGDLEVVFVVDGSPDASHVSSTSMLGIASASTRAHIGAARAFTIAARCRRSIGPRSTGTTLPSTIIR